MVRRSITFPSQCRELTLMRQDDQVWAGEHRSPAAATLKRLDLALQAFFRRVKAGAAVTLTAAMLAIPMMAKSRSPSRCYWCGRRTAWSEWWPIRRRPTDRHRW